MTQNLKKNSISALNIDDYSNIFEIKSFSKTYRISLNLDISNKNILISISQKNASEKTNYQKKLSIEELDRNEFSFFTPFKNNITKLFKYLERLFNSKLVSIQTSINNFLILILYCLKENKSNQIQIFIPNKNFINCEKITFEEKVQNPESKEKEEKKENFEEKEEYSLKDEKSIESKKLKKSRNRKMINVEYNYNKVQNILNNNIQNNENNISSENYNNLENIKSQEMKNINDMETQTINYYDYDCAPVPHSKPCNEPNKSDINNNIFYYNFKKKDYYINLYKNEIKSKKYKEIIIKIIDKKDNNNIIQYKTYLDLVDFLHLSKPYYHLFNYSIDDIYDDLLIILYNHNFKLDIRNKNIRFYFNIFNVGKTTNSELYYQVSIIINEFIEEKTQEEIDFKINDYYIQLYKYIKDEIEVEKEKKSKKRNLSKIYIENEDISLDNNSIKDTTNDYFKNSEISDEENIENKYDNKKKNEISEKEKNIILEIKRKKIINKINIDIINKINKIISKKNDNNNKNNNKNEQTNINIEYQKEKNKEDNESYNENKISNINENIIKENNLDLKEIAPVKILKNIISINNNNFNITQNNKIVEINNNISLNEEGENKIKSEINLEKPINKVTPVKKIKDKKQIKKNSKSSKSNKFLYHKRDKIYYMPIDMYFKPKVKIDETLNISNYSIDIINYSIILKEEQIKLIINKFISKNFLLNLNDKKLIFKLIYEIKLENDGKNSEQIINEFYEKSKGVKNIIFLIKTVENKIFGGFNKNGFILENTNYFNYKDIDSVIFSIDKMKTYEVVDKHDFCVLCQKDKLPEFKEQIMFEKNNVFYGYTGNKYKGYLIEEDYELNSGKKQFYVKSIQLISIGIDN